MGGAETWPEVGASANGDAGARVWVVAVLGSSTAVAGAKGDVDVFSISQLGWMTADSAGAADSAGTADSVWGEISKTGSCSRAMEATISLLSKSVAITAGVGVLAFWGEGARSRPAVGADEVVVVVFDSVWGEISKTGSCSRAMEATISLLSKSVAVTAGVGVVAFWGEGARSRPAIGADEVVVVVFGGYGARVSSTGREADRARVVGPGILLRECKHDCRVS